MTKRPDSKRLIEFHEFLIQFQAVERRTLNPRDLAKQENDVEHSYYLAMAAWMLAPHFNLDKDKCIRVALAHDLVEVYAGDTFAFASEDELSTKDQREHESLERIRKEWPDFADMITEIEDYKYKLTEEAKFVYVLDKIMPVIVNMMSNGIGWSKNEITLEMFIAEKERKIPKESPLYPYYQELLEMLHQSPHYFHKATK